MDVNPNLGHALAALLTVLLNRLAALLERKWARRKRKRVKP